MGFIKSTDHRHTDHRPTDHRPFYSPTHPPTDPPTKQSPTQPTRFYFKDLINKKKSYYRKQKQLGKCKRLRRSTIYLTNKNIFITLGALSRKLHFYKRYTEDLNMYIFYILNITPLLLPRYVTVSF